MSNTGTNPYAEILRAQGKYVITHEGVDWFEYSGFMLPAYLPHCCPPITAEMARKVVRISGRPFARWTSRFGEVANSEWWCVLRKEPWAIEDIKDRDKRYKIRKGKKNFIVRPLTSGEILNDCPRVTQLATARYKTKTKLETPDSFKKSVDASQKVPGVIEYIGCFHDNVLVSFSENYIQDNAVFMVSIRQDPVFLKDYSSYALIDGILEYYLNQKRFRYVLDGSRCIYHRTNFQELLMKIFGFQKEYALLNVVYSKKFTLGVRLAWPFRKVFWAIRRKWPNSFLDNVSAVLRQEAIRRNCCRSTTA
jgi:hypothetical protein